MELKETEGEGNKMKCGPLISPPSPPLRLQVWQQPRAQEGQLRTVPFPFLEEVGRGLCEEADRGSGRGLRGLPQENYHHVIQQRGMGWLL